MSGNNCIEDENIDQANAYMNKILKLIDKIVPMSNKISDFEISSMIYNTTLRIRRECSINFPSHVEEAYKVLKNVEKVAKQAIKAEMSDSNDSNVSSNSDNDLD